MKINVYLPDVIGNRAKGAGFNLSRLLRDAVEAKLAEDKHFNLREIKFTIIGTSPLIQHNWPKRGEIPL